MEQSLITYSLIRALYDEGRDYIDSFWPFAVRVLSPDRSAMTPETVADLISDRFELRVPVHTTRTLLERAKKRGGLVVRRDHAYSLTKAGVEYLQTMETERSVERRLTAFVQAAGVFLALEHDIVADREHVQEMIERVVERSQSIFSFVIERPETSPVRDVTAEDAAVLHFFQHVEKELPDHFETLRDLILGSTLAGLLRRTDINDATRHFDQTRLFLDTNFLLSVLELRFPLECRPALELLSLLNRSTRFELLVFDFTLEEVFGLLRGFSQESGKYPAGIRIDSLFSSMKSRGLTPADVPRLIAGMEDELAALGISIHETGLVLDDVKVDADQFSRLGQYKPEQDSRGRCHDLKAVELVADFRRKPARRVEEGGVFFLSEDTRLSKYAFIELGHKRRETVSEVMPDRLMTNLLWLKDPETLERVSVPTVIAMHSRDLFIDRAVWLRFFGILQKLQEGGDLDPKAASLLLYDAQLHRDLAGLGVGRASEVDDAWVLGRLEAAREDAESVKAFELQRQALALRQEFENAEARAEAERQADRRRLGERIRELERRDERRGVGIARALARAKRTARDRARTWVIVAKAVLLLVSVVAIIFGAPLLSSRWEQAEPVAWLLGVVLLLLNLLGWTIDPLDFWQGVRTRIEVVLMDRSLTQLEPLIGSGDEQAEEQSRASA